MNRAYDRVTADLSGDFVVFLIGMRINQPWKIRAWLPVFLAMPRMLRELQSQPELGLLGAHFHGLTQVQYWRSIEHLHAYARAQDRAHLPAWRAYQRHARAAGGAVGIWHETYLVPAGAHESIYVNMPPTGLGRAGTLRPATGHRQTAQGRLGNPVAPTTP
ncbi:DUF4188 domain-containing protein [Deinococcus maricopensis]|uniref:Uncharacterized protein n=1 Tax=Deinococcus maricopensis (strain DSM 21211 / LMG 22137 / NRRL B-23946 / LB-34) TaxID=709986 RepID=E8U4I6_DEIML|nr:DUF4188 domain-containing protein [Deinococcus maricopensis]ADV68851.1 hypothetical protein Deima_3224 [Deinococcus maricopensis DSM 21211]